jgi:outer membrane protein insertion porin family
MESLHPLIPSRAHPWEAIFRRALQEIAAAIWTATRRSAKTLKALSLALALWSAEAVEMSTHEPARVKISGFGFLGNREVARLLGNFQPDGKMPFAIDRTFVEDTALVLLARAHDEGYLRAILNGDFTMADGSRRHFAWTNAMEATLPRDFTARAAHFQLQGGVRFYYHSLEFNGVKTLSKREASSYFLSGEMLLQLRDYRIFSPAALRSSLAALKEAYARAGYQEAVVSTHHVTWNESTGAVTVKIAVQEGLPTIVRSVTVRMRGGEEEPKTLRILKPGEPYSQLWQQGLAQKLQAEQQNKGFPDATVEFSSRRRETNATSIQLDLSANVTVGPFIRVGGLKFVGNHHTKTSVLKSRIHLDEGDSLNRVEAEKSRQRLARLGVFDSVRLRYETVDDKTRDLIYEVEEAKPMALSVLAGYGSYELLRGGLEFEDRNVFERAHNLQLRGVQSFK